MTNEHVTFTVEGITCESSAHAVRNALIRLNGVEDVTVHADILRVAVEYDAERIGLETLRGTIEDAGFKVR